MQVRLRLVVAGFASDFAAGDEVADAIGSFRAGERLGRSQSGCTSQEAGERTSGRSGVADVKKVFLFFCCRIGLLNLIVTYCCGSIDHCEISIGCRTDHIQHERPSRDHAVAEAKKTYDGSSKRNKKSHWQL